MTNNIKRSLIKTITWRMVGSMDTITVSYLVTGTIAPALTIGAIGLVTKMVLYFLHEIYWSWKKKKKEENQTMKTTLIKTLTWRLIGSFDTFIISSFVVEKIETAATIGGIGFFTKSTLYFIHEWVWSKLKFGKEVKPVIEEDGINTLINEKLKLNN